MFGSWIEGPQLPHNKNDCSCVTVDDAYILAIGGIGTNDLPVASIDFLRVSGNATDFHPAPSWTVNQMPPLLRPRMRHRGEFWRGSLLVICGEVNGVIDQSVEMFTSLSNPMTTMKRARWVPQGQWTQVQNLPYFEDIVGTFILKDSIYAVGRLNIFQYLIKLSTFSLLNNIIETAYALQLQEHQQNAAKLDVRV